MLALPASIFIDERKINAEASWTAALCVLAALVAYRTYVEIHRSCQRGEKDPRSGQTCSLVTCRGRALAALFATSASAMLAAWQTTWTTEGSSFPEFVPRVTHWSMLTIVLLSTLGMVLVEAGWTFFLERALVRRRASYEGVD